jgi:hypothetical protein
MSFVASVIEQAWAKIGALYMRRSAASAVAAARASRVATPPLM